MILDCNIVKTWANLNFFLKIHNMMCYLISIYRMKTIVLAVTLCLLVHNCVGCSIWNHDKSCHCSCEDSSISCRKTCSNMCRRKSCGTIGHIEQNRCYTNCSNAFARCLDQCPTPTTPTTTTTTKSHFQW